MGSARQWDKVLGGGSGEAGLQGQLAVEHCCDHSSTDACEGWALEQCRQRGLAPASLPGMLPAGHGQGGGSSSVLAWQLPALPSAPSDPAKRELKFSLLLSIGKKP